jgi:hypothetical protein
MQKFQNILKLSLAATFCLLSTSFAVAQSSGSPTALYFGNVVVDTSSAIKTVTLTSKQTSTLANNSISVPGGGYALDPSTTCANSGMLAAGARCTIAVTLTPTAFGAIPVP